MVIERSRLEQTTVHGALCSAMLLVGRNASPAWRRRSIRIFSPVNARSPLGVGDEVGLYLGKGAVDFEPDTSMTFWAIARHATRTLNVPEVLTSMHELTQGLRGTLAQGLDVDGAVKWRQSALARDIMVTNLGRLHFQENFGTLEISSMWGPLAMSGYPGDHSVGVATVGANRHLTLASRQPFPSMLEQTQAVLASHL
jgi:hypothetical protein